MGIWSFGDLLRCRVSAVTSRRRRDFADKLRFYLAVADALHPGEMLQVIVRLKESITSVELDQDASYAPNVTRVAPPKTQDDLRGPVVSSRDHC